jgi:predicted ribosomally synthesized peptide with nif11-like leader
MSAEALAAFIAVVRQDPDLQQAMAAAAAADVDAVAQHGREAGFDVVSRDFVDHNGGALVEYEDEDYFLKASWWTLG